MKKEIRQAAAVAFSPLFSNSVWEVDKADMVCHYNLDTETFKPIKNLLHIITKKPQTTKTKTPN